MIFHTIFVVDDEESIRSGLTHILKGKYRIRGFPAAEEALAAVKEAPPDLVLLDLGLPGMSGIDALRELKAVSPEIQVVVITAYDDVKSVVSAMKNGAHDYIVKPLQADTLDVSIRNALEAVRLKKEIRDLQERYLRENLPGFIGTSDTIQDVMELVATLAISPDTPILILGETGTGKELIASAVHYRSPNFKGPFVSVNCAAIPRELIESELFGYEKGAFSGASTGGKKGLVEHAAGGTLFLDEVGDLSMEAQAKFLRFLEEGEFYRVGGTRKHHVRTRVVSATNKDLAAMIGKGLFREDLYYRLAVATIAVPSLNDRPDDILPLARHFLLEFNRKFGKSFTGISSEAETALKAHRWRGNVRELKNLVERGALIGKEKVLDLRDLGLDMSTAGRDGKRHPEERNLIEFPPGGIDLVSVQEALERRYIEAALLRTEGNESKAAKLLNINHHTFRYRRKKLNV
ncbi:MAG: sigma-54-dependent Fis family transcriptional regulator [Deltaproteobacteria bacterium]|nr:sigma-54-dependent Fis family transcriptional regulator [Deltaproteobacteria bacterium]